MLMNVAITVYSFVCQFPKYSEKNCKVFETLFNIIFG